MTGDSTEVHFLKLRAEFVSQPPCTDTLITQVFKCLSNYTALSARVLPNLNGSLALRFHIPSLYLPKSSRSLSEAAVPPLRYP